MTPAQGHERRRWHGRWSDRPLDLHLATGSIEDSAPRGRDKQEITHLEILILILVLAILSLVLSLVLLALFLGTLLRSWIAGGNRGIVFVQVVIIATTTATATATSGRWSSRSSRSDRSKKSQSRSQGWRRRVAGSRAADRRWRCCYMLHHGQHGMRENERNDDEQNTSPAGKEQHCCGVVVVVGVGREVEGVFPISSRGSRGDAGQEPVPAITPSRLIQDVSNIKNQRHSRTQSFISQPCPYTVQTAHTHARTRIVTAEYPSADADMIQHRRDDWSILLDHPHHHHGGG